MKIKYFLLRTNLKILFDFKSIGTIKNIYKVSKNQGKITIFPRVMDIEAFKKLSDFHYFHIKIFNDILSKKISHSYILSNTRVVI